LRIKEIYLKSIIYDGAYYHSNSMNTGRYNSYCYHASILWTLKSCKETIKTKKSNLKPNLSL